MSWGCVWHTFTNDGMEKVYTAKCSGDDWIDFVIRALKSHASVTPNMGEDVTFTYFDQRQLTVVAVRQEVCVQQSANSPLG